MDTLWPVPRGIAARALIAGLMAWVLVLLGVAAAPPRLGAFDLGAAAVRLDRCASDADGHRHSPGPHLPCACCIPCRAFQIDGAAGHPAILPTNIAFSAPFPETILIDPSPSAKATSAVGWLSSWSSRAPPIARLEATLRAASPFWQRPASAVHPFRPI